MRKVALPIAASLLVLSFVASNPTPAQAHEESVYGDVRISVGWQSEPPLVNEEAKTLIQENMAFVVHPNTYMPGVGYLVLGDTVIVTRDGYELVTKSGRELRGV